MTAGTHRSDTSHRSTTLGNAPINWKPTTRTATGPNEGGGPLGLLHEVLIVISPERVHRLGDCGARTMLPRREQRISRNPEQLTAASELTRAKVH